MRHLKEEEIRRFSHRPHVDPAFVGNFLSKMGLDSRKAKRELAMCYPFISTPTWAASDDGIKMACGKPFNYKERKEVKVRFKKSRGSCNYSTIQVSHQRGRKGNGKRVQGEESCNQEGDGSQL